MDDYTKILIHIILFLNNRALKKIIPDSGDDGRPGGSHPANLWRWYEDMGRSVLMDVRRGGADLRSPAQGRGQGDTKGVAFHGLTYFDPGLRQLLEQLRNKVTVAYSPEDTSQVYLLHDHNCYPLPLSQASSRYQGLSEEELAACRAQEQGRVRGMAAQETEARVELLRRSREAIVGEKTENMSARNSTGRSSKRTGSRRRGI